MISKQEAIAITLADIKSRGEEIDSICSEEEVRLELSTKLSNRQEVDDVYVVKYYIPWGLDFVSIYVDLSAHTGEIYDRTGPAPYRV
jgi:hypothetical protein